MKKVLGLLAIAAVLGGVLAFGDGNFTDVDKPQYWGKTKIPKLTAAIDANFALIESGDITNDTVKAQNVVAVTNVTAGATVQGEHLYSTDDAVVDDDLTVTGDAGVSNLTATATVQAEHLYSTDDAVIDDDLTVTGVVNGRGLALASSTDDVMVQTANITMHAGTVYTNTFNPVFTAAPIVTATYTEDPGDVRPLYVTSVASNQVLVTATADKNFAIIAVGTK